MDNHFMARNMPKWISTRKKPASDPNKNRHWIIRNELLSKNSSRFLLVSHENGKDLWKIREYEAGGNERPSTVRSFVEGTYPIEFKFRTEGTLQGFRTLWMKSWLIPSILWIKRNHSLLEETTEPYFKSTSSSIPERILSPTQLFGAFLPQNEFHSSSDHINFHRNATHRCTVNSIVYEPERTLLCGSVELSVSTHISKWG